MTLKDRILSWDTTWRYDYWWRQKHNIAFNSEAHRNANPLDIAFEYYENILATEAMKQKGDEEERLKLLKQGQLFTEERIQDKRKDLWDKMKLTQFD